MSNQRANFNEVITGQYQAILKEAPDTFKAFICTPRGSFCVGTFNSYDEAHEAAQEAQQAKWNG